MSKYRPFTLAATARRIREFGCGDLRDFWVCLGDFLDDWYAADPDTRQEMLREEPRRPATGGSTRLQPVPRSHPPAGRFSSVPPPQAAWNRS